MEKINRRLYKRKFFIIIVLLAILLPHINLNEAVAVDINFSIQPEASATCWSQSGYVGSPNNIRDDSTSTYLLIDDDLIVGYYAGWAEIDFGIVVPTISRVEIMHRLLGNGGGTWTVFLYYEGDWHAVMHQPMDMGPSGNFDTRTDSVTGSWNNVSKMKVESEGGGGNITYSRYSIYEFRAWGLSSTYIDIGLRVYDGSQVISIACEPEGTLTSPLRIAKDGIIYGVALVDFSDASASKIRIQTSSGIKALRKY